MGLTELKQFLRVDYDDDDVIIQMIRDAVLEEMKDVIPGFDEKELTSRQKILVCLYVKELYDKREQTTTQSEEKVRFAVQSMMLKERLK
uniref:Head tail connector n=1 Tax=Myoviridae sp. ctBvM24 TaxID=2825050 RepID=A0A8S5UCV6_9CAUD|nr:MAG TPA: head tail connector [Myoviridae sp. ctBvM24]